MTTATGRGGGLALALAIVVADQLTKLWVLHRADFSGGPIALAPFLDITLVWNRGISYGLFQTDGWGRWVLVGLTGVAIVALCVWMMRTQRALVALGVAAIVGGAVGNLIDRLLYGAVVDFVHFHVGRFSWYIFNIADAAIVVGVIALLLDSFGVSPSTKPKGKR